MMTDRNSKNINYPSQLAIIAGLTSAGFVASLILTVVIWVIMEGKLPLKTEDILQPKYYNTLMILQAVSTLFIFFLPAVFFAVICYRKPRLFLGLNLHISTKQFFLGIGILILAFPLAGALGELNQALPIPQSWAAKFKSWELAREAEEAAFVQINTFPKYLMSLLIIGLLPGLFEEIYFRAAVQNFFTRWFKGPWLAIIVTSIIFSAIHGSYYGFLVRFGLGMILGLIYYYSKSLWLNALMHFLFNGLQVTELYENNLRGIKPTKDVEQNFPLWMGVVALVLMIYLFMVFKKASAVELAKYPAEQLPETEFEHWLNKSQGN